MSWDLDITGYIDGNPVHLGDWNYTHNTNGMIRGAGFEEWPYALHDEPAAWVGDKLEAVLAEWDANPNKYIALNPDNGWGDFHRLREVIREIYERCRKFPSARVTVHG